MGLESASREIPSAKVESTARIMATRWMWIALIPGVLTLLFALVVIGAENSPRHHEHGIVGVVLACVIFVGLPGLLTILYVLRARRYAQLAKIAVADPSLRWHLTGKTLAAAREGIPQPELAFGIAGAVRRSLTAVPRATLVR